MSYDISWERGDGPSKVDAIARKCRLDEEDEARALSVYQGMIDAIAEQVATGAERPSAPPALVYIAAYQHRYGVDVSAHASYEHAEARLLSIAWQQCMRDAAIRAAVDARFGPLVSEEPPLEPPFESDLHDGDGDECSAIEAPEDSSLDSMSRGVGVLAPIGWADNGAREGDPREAKRRTFCEKLLEEWPDFAPGESLWIAECALERDEQDEQDEQGEWDEHDGYAEREDSPEHEATAPIGRRPDQESASPGPSCVAASVAADGRARGSP